MKSFVKFTTLAIAFAVVACTGVQEWDNTPYTPEPVIPEPEEPGVVEFKATVATKTSLDEESGNVSWVIGDEVKFVWEGGSVVSAAKTSGQETTFKVKIAEGVEQVYAVYPATIPTTEAKAPTKAPTETPKAPATIDKLANKLIPLPININNGPSKANNPAITIITV